MTPFNFPTMWFSSCLDNGKIGMIFKEKPHSHNNLYKSCLAFRKNPLYLVQIIQSQPLEISTKRSSKIESIKRESCGATFFHECFIHPWQKLSSKAFTTFINIPTLSLSIYYHNFSALFSKVERQSSSLTFGSHCRAKVGGLLRHLLFKAWKKNHLSLYLTQKTFEA